MKKNGFTLIEVLASISLISIFTLIFLNTIINYTKQNAYSDFVFSNEANRLDIIKTIQNDFINLELDLSLTDLEFSPNRELTFRFKDGSEKTLKVSKDYLSYDKKIWNLQNKGDYFYDLNNLQVTYDELSCSNESCLNYQTLQINIPIDTTTTKDDISLFYLGYSLK